MLSGPSWQSRAAAIERVDAARARLRFRCYVEAAWHVVEPSTPFVPGWHIDAICEHLEAVTCGQIRDLVINMPPRHAKSLLVSVFWPTWEWIRWPERRWLFASYAASLSTRDSLKCRRIIESPWYQRHYGDIYQLTGDQNAKVRYDNDATGYRIATSVGGSATGEGGDRLVADDPHNVREAESDAIRESTLTWWDETMSTRGNDPKTVARVIVMQRVHHGDLTAHVLAQGGYEHLCLPAEYEGRARPTGIGWCDPRREPGELLWPARFGPDELARLKRSLGSYGAAGQLQQRPSPAEGGIFKRHWWRYYDTPPVEVDDLIQSWDLTFTDSKASDYVVGQVWGRIGANRYLLDQVRGRMDFVATKAAMLALRQRWPGTTATLVENKANGAAILSSLRDEIAGLIPINPRHGKRARGFAVTPIIEAGNVWLPDPKIAPWITEFVEEHAAFDNGVNDDQVDAETQANSYLSGWDSSEELIAIHEDDYQISPY